MWVWKESRKLVGSLTVTLFCRLEPEGDPLCVLLMIDYFALRAGEYEFLLDLFKAWEVREDIKW